MRQIKIAPSIMCADFLHLERDIRRLEKGGAGLFHFDVMDGIFVPNITMGTDILKAVRAITRLPLDAHLMISCPERYIEEFIKAGSNIVCIHAESTVHLDRLLQIIKKSGVKSAVALNPSTPLNCLKYVLDKLDIILIMAVNPGFAGQAFIPSTVEKVRELRLMLQENGAEHIEIEVDGCINDSTIAMLLEAGANIFVGGTSGVFIRGMDISLALLQRYKNARKSLEKICREGDERLKKWWKG